MINYFPTSLALKPAFCNRKEELKELVYNIEGMSPSLLMSTRRYGKTSLALNAFATLKWPYAHIDFYKALSEEDIEKTILNSVGKLLGVLETKPMRLLQLASDFFSSMHVKVVLEKAGIALDFSRSERRSAVSILEALEKLHALALSKKTKIILFMDEFQTVGEVTSNCSIEAAIREAAQKSTNVAYVFSGSNRHLMQEMFSDKKRPFFRLCNLITLDRISENDYSAYIQKAAKIRWKKALPENVIEQIFKRTERHPYYLNKLCSLLWSNNYPDVKAVMNRWSKYTLENKSQVERELGFLSVNQRRILIAIAQNGAVKEPFGKRFAAMVDISLSSISRAITILIEKDYLFIDKDGLYQILDPLIRDVLL